MATFVVAHGAWSAGWAWKKMRPLMRAAGHELWTPTYTGLGERAHLGHADVSLDTHVQDVIAVLETEDLNDVILIGHSYGGMVATGVADRARARIKHLVYLDAFAPTDGQAVFDLVPPDIAAKMRAGAAASASGFGIPPNPMPSDTSPEDQAWAGTAATAAAGEGVLDQADAWRGAGGAAHYIYAKRIGIGDTFGAFLRAREARGMEDVRDRFEPQSAHHQSAGAARHPQRDRRAMTTARQIGIAGLGLLGGALAHRLIQAGYSPKGFDIDAAKVAAFAKAGGVAAKLDDVAHCDVVLLAVFDTNQVEDVVTNAVLPALTPGVPKIVLCASTCDPDRIATLADKVAARGLTLIETPVSGSSVQVRNGDGVGLLGGSKDAIDGVADIIDALYPKWFYMGPAGHGGRAKLAINHMLGLNRLVLAEGLVFAQALGLDPAALLDVARQSAAYSQVMDIKGPKMVSGDYTPQGFIHQSLKDFKLIIEQAAKRGQEMPLATLNADVLAACVSRGESERDNAAVIEEIKRRKKPPTST